MRSYAWSAATVGDEAAQWNFEQLSHDLGQFLPSSQTDALPVASADYRCRIITVLGDGVSTGDVTSICLLAAAGTYSWQTLATG